MTDQSSAAALPKIFDHAEAEPRLYAAWEAAGCFRPSGEGEPYAIVFPPPNVTGRLHMGHALNATLQDILIRYNRMRGKNVLWQVGTDHAGIATQMMVERQLAAENQPDRHTLGRAAFLERVWAWKEESGGAIQDQMRRLGASCDWTRERFTMDEGLSLAVRETFVRLYKEGLIYRDKRLVNWDPKLLTAISDLEVENREVAGHMWHVAYPLADGPVDGVEEIVIATTRPETMLGDGAVAVHPSDERYQALVGKRVRLPVGDRLIPIIADEYPDPEFGSGAVKITGAHDFNDHEVAKRHDLPMIILMDEQARMRAIEEIPETYHGLDRYAARQKVIEEVEAKGCLRLVEDKPIVQPFGDRSGVVIEPMLTDQWWVDAETLAGPALEAVKSNRTSFVPDNWSKTYYQWLENIQPWCISRQLWWGHQIPVWYGPDGTPFCALTEEEARAAAADHYGQDTALVQDEDVLDTWFSSALWPFSTLGWPQDETEVKTFYPTAVLSTAFDIIFFWVARMMMMGLHLQGDVPFRQVYIHALVRDAQGQKMSKTKGNVIDPLEKMDAYGTDSLRFTLAAMATPGRDVKLADSRIEGYRNFRTKLWNAARFALMNEASLTPDYDPAEVKTPLCQWILHEVSATERRIDTALADYRFDDAAQAIYGFTWNIYCDWFLEFAKPVFAGDDQAAVTETRATAAFVLDRILVLLHPFMPYVTEELWGLTAERQDFLMRQTWQGPERTNPDAAEAVNFLIALISEIRSLRTEMNVPAKSRPALILIGVADPIAARVEEAKELIERLGRIEGIESADSLPEGALQFVVDGHSFALPVAESIDLAAEIDRLSKEQDKISGEIAKIDKKLANQNFVAKAPPEVVEEQHERRADFLATSEKLMAALERLRRL
ncbi:valyl-tRNA synthetase [Parvularcula bermudensis HTCC2503]|uniref:Valine--tRNA ligase n=1 Tax=Parvularcula bermudensis (strain ATCC BAA-594 / HTCC2503 / KCTC 12087) TaxID=314260 RepID=E0TH69_PARBH|nr:valine--tRNA ligase [Parvularcula bermudensis]ADM09653.1 valyl-tRNA synthetase [Parvularcula bermudensis HTCC2503]